MFLLAAFQNELLEYELKLFGPSALPLVPTESFASLGFGYQKPAGDIQTPMFNHMTMPSIFERVNPNDHPTNFTFGAERKAEDNPQDNNSDGGVNQTSTENLMDSS